jgi:hypothetical protein
LSSLPGKASKFNERHGESVPPPGALFVCGVVLALDGERTTDLPHAQIAGVCSRSSPMRRRSFAGESFSAELFDDLDEFVQAVPVVAGEIDELLRSLDNGATLGSPSDRDATPAPNSSSPRREAAVENAARCSC